jgi:hypothetical protein
MRSLLAAAVIALATLPASGVHAADNLSFTLTIKDQRYDQAELQDPAGQKFELVVLNQDATAEEFESNDLHREKIVPAGGKVTLKLGPLKPGKYEFFGDFNPKTARGHIVAR